MFPAAASAVALTQSAASTALAELERQTGKRLFDRVGKSLRLNEQGRSLLPKVVELLDRAAEIDDLLLGNEAIGHLTVGATLTIGNYLATLIVAEFPAPPAGAGEAGGAQYRQPAAGARQP